jgi:hypothetical protein
MPKVRTEALRDGMVVATEVKNMDDMLLVSAGCVITEKLIDILSAWGISEVEVEACDGVEEPGDILQQLPAETLKELTTELESVFWEAINTSPVQKEAFKLALRRKAKQVSASRGRAHDEQH